VSRRSSASTRSPAVVLSRDRRPRRAGGLPERKRRLLVDLRERPPPSWPARRRPDAAARHGDGFKFWLADGSWLLVRRRAPSRSSGSTPRRPSSDCASAARGRRAAGARRMSGDGGARRAGRQAVGPRADLGHTDRYVGKVLVIEAGKRLSLQRHEVKDESILVPRAGCGCTSRTTTGTSGRGARSGRAPPRPDRPDPPLRGDRADRADRGLDPELDDVVRLEDDFGREGRAPRARRSARRTISGVLRPSARCTLRHATAITGRGA
jgi:hypothetical protein